MRKAVALAILFIIGAVIFVPAVLVRSLSPTGMENNMNSTGPHKGEDIPVRVYLHQADQIVTMRLEDYVAGVVAAEMPAEFDVEALKAQAVAARTYAVKNMGFFGGSGLAGRPGADVSTDHRENQAWMSEEQAKNRWGPFKSDIYWRKITRAVEDTRGLILTHDGTPIHAVFHSTSGDHTASAKEVWGFDYPYLQSVPCRWDQKAPRYQDSKEYALTVIEERLGPEAGVVAAAQSGKAAVAQVLERTASGRVDKIRIGTKTWTGLVLRDKLELRSTNFTVDVKGDKMTIKTMGYGHGVGLCQYGADGMAREGRDYRQILSYYYSGVGVRNIHGS